MVAYSGDDKYAPRIQNPKQQQQRRGKLRLYKFHPQENNPNSTMTFETVLEHVVLAITNKYDNGPDFADALLNQETIDLDLLHVAPQKVVLQAEDIMTQEEHDTDVSTLTQAEKTDFDNEIKKRLKATQATYNDTYKHEVEAFAKTKAKLPKTLSRAAAFILQTYCTEQMKMKLEQQDDYKTLRKDPIELLKTIKILMHDSTRSTKHVVTMHTMLTRFLNTKQQKNESLDNYTKRLRDQFSVISTMFGSSLVTGYCSHLDEYKSKSPTEQFEYAEAFLQEWSAYVLMSNAKPDKYSELPESLATQYALDNDNYPANIAQAYDALNKFSPEKNRAKKSNPRPPQTDHNASKTSFMQKQDEFRPGIYCNKCGEEGHTPKNCPHPDILLSDWYCRKAIMAMKASEAVRQTKTELQAQQVIESESEFASPAPFKKQSTKRRAVGGGQF